MKVGTDGVLLGAWASLKKAPGSILDIGTGTGLIALQMAQRYHASLQDFADEMDETHDLTISNPPFYKPLLSRRREYYCRE